METIESIRSQTYGKYEIIIKDGMSMDGSLDSLIQEADRGDSRIRIHSQADKGIYDARNPGGRICERRLSVLPECRGQLL